MRSRLFFDGPDGRHKLTNFWVLLSLAAIIASAGVVADSTATVIGAMIVAPLMTPILGTVLAIMTADKTNLPRSLALVVVGGASVVAIGFVVGMTGPIGTTAATSSQVESRIHPHLIDLVAALATGAVGAFAVIRSDVSDTLPGVAIAISLVPPLAVVGLTLQAGAPDESLGAMLLFLTNVGAILLTGLIVMVIFGVQHAAGELDDATPGRIALTPVVTVVGFVAALTIALGISSYQFNQERVEASDVQNIAETWAAEGGWSIVDTSVGKDAIEVRAIGALPSPDPLDLRDALDAAGLEGVDVRLELVPQETVDLQGR